MKRKRSNGFRRIFTVAFLLFLALLGGSNPARQSLTFTQPNPKKPIKSFFENTTKLATSFFFRFFFTFFLFVNMIFLVQAQVVKGLRRHARGRFGRIEYKYIHFFFKLEEVAPPKQFYDKVCMHLKRRKALLYSGI